MRARPIRRTLAALLCATGAMTIGGVSPSTASTQGRHGPPPVVRFATFNASLNRNLPGQLIERPVHPGQRPGGDGGRDHPAGAARRGVDQRVRLRRRRRRGAPVPAELPVGAAQRRGGDRLPVPLRGAVQHRDPVGPGPQQRRLGRRARRRLRIRLLPRPVRHGRLLDAPDRARRRPHLPDVPLGRHARAPCYRTIRRRPSRPTGTPPTSWASCACRRSRTGTSRLDVDGRTVHFLVSHPTPAGLRRPRGPQRATQPRRDPVLGRLRHARAEVGIHLRRRRAARVAWRPEPGSSSPATRTPTHSTATACPARSSSCSTIRG